MTSGTEALRSRLEVLLGARPEAAIQPQPASSDPRDVRALVERRDRVAAAGGEMLGAVFQFLGELVATGVDTPVPSDAVVGQVHNRLKQCVEEDSEGRQCLSITLPNRQSLDQLASTLARLMVVSDESGVDRG
jgi:hypothetical protein